MAVYEDSCRGASCTSAGYKSTVINIQRQFSYSVQYLRYYFPPMKRFVVGFPQNVDETFAKNENCSCFRCLISSRNTRIEHFLPSSTQRTIPTLNSISSPAVSLPEVKTHPRTFPRSCSRISYTKKRLDRFPSRAFCTTTSGCTSCCENLEHRGDMAENELGDTREVDR